jgi:hypothetical protein
MFFFLNKTKPLKFIGYLNILHCSTININ